MKGILQTENPFLSYYWLFLTECLSLRPLCRPRCYRGFLNYAKMANKNRGVGRVPQGGGRRGNTQGPLQEGDDLLVDVVEVSDKATDFFEQNRNTIIYGVFALAALVVGFLLFRTFYSQPREVEAMDQMQQAQVQFERDSFQLALANPGQGYPGFLDIIDQYGGTDAGNLARYYAGISFLNIGSHEAALDYLQQFDADGEMLPITKAGAIGDAQSELGDFDAAINSYEKAVDLAEENFLLGGYYLNKLAMLYRNQGDNAAALEAFRRLKNDFGNSPQAEDADKYIMLLEGN